LDVIEFDRWQEEVFHRRTLFGILQFYVGRVVALTFIVKLCMSVKNVVYPEYSTEMIDKTTKFIVSLINTSLGIKREEGAIAVTIAIEYIMLAGMALLIVVNVQSFLKKLLVTLKNIMRDNEIGISYNTTILSFSFIMGTYYFSILLQMSV